MTEHGAVMGEMISNATTENRGDGVVTTVAFSRKRADKTPMRYLHEKIWAYVRMIWHEALVIDAACDPRSEKPVAAVVEAQARVFRYPDMATTRAGIGAATAKLLARRVAIIGLGGTGRTFSISWPRRPSPRFISMTGMSSYSTTHLEPQGLPTPRTLENRKRWTVS